MGGWHSAEKRLSIVSRGVAHRSEIKWAVGAVGSASH